MDVFLSNDFCYSPRPIDEVVEGLVFDLCPPMATLNSSNEAILPKGVILVPELLPSFLLAAQILHLKHLQLFGHPQL